MIDLRISLTGVEQWLKNILSFRRSLPVRTGAALEGHVATRLAAIRRDFETKSGLGRSLDRKGRAHFDGIVVAVKTRLQNGGIETGVELRGLAAVIEKGGRLRAHTIKGKPSLAFVGKGGRRVVVPSVNHPGGRVRPHELAVGDLKRSAPGAAAAVTRAVDRLKAETFG